MTAPLTLTPSDRLLLMHLGGLGDVVLATPALQALRARYPTNHIAILVAAHAAHLLDHAPLVNEQYVLSSTREGLGWWLQAGQDHAVLHALRDRSFQLAINLYPVYSRLGGWRLAYYLRHIRPRQSLGYNTNGRAPCFTHALPQSTAEREASHEAAHALTLVRQVDCALLPLTPQVWVTEEERRTAHAQLRDWSCDPATTVVLSPGAFRMDKQWPADRFTAVGRWLATRHGLRLLVVGDAHDRAVATAIAGALGPAAVNLAGRTSVRELMALLALARLVVTNDTGTLHLAAALQRPLVALAGPTNLTRFGPLGAPARQRVLQPSSRRLRDLPVTDVQAAIEALLAGVAA